MSAATDSIEGQELIREAFPVTKHGKAEAAWFAAARKLGLETVSRAEGIWKGKARRIDNWEMEALRRAALKERQSDIANGRRRIAELKERLGLQRPDMAG